MISQDYHMHTTYCDGTASAEEMVQAAIGQGLTEVGISGHSHTPFDESYCMFHETTQIYRRELEVLREKYADRISVKIGLEMDRYSDADTAGFDYLIGSVHYIRVPAKGKRGVPAPQGSEMDGCGGSLKEPDAVPGDTASAPVVSGCMYHEEPEGAFIYIPIDETPEILRNAADAYFGGDLIALARRYFETAATVAEATGCDIIGHFDLITKFNEGGALFDETNPGYSAAWQGAADQLLQYDIPFEINTGAMSKGYRTEPYPAKPIRDYIRGKGGRLILSSDSHRTDTLCWCFDQYETETTP